MDVIQSSNKQVDKFGSGLHGFQSGVPGVTLATAFTPAWCDMVQQELVNQVLDAGIALSGASQTQVRQALRRMFGGNLRTVAAGATALGADDAGDVYVDATAGAVAITLPASDAANGRPQQLRFFRVDTSANAVTISRAGSNTIVNGQASGNSIGLRVGEDLQLRSNGGNGASGTWRVAVGAMSRSFSGGGASFQWLASGLLLQTVTGTVGSGADLSLSFATTFPNAILGRVVSSRNGFGSNGTYAQIGAESLSAISIGAWRGGTPSRVSEVCDAIVLGW